MRRGMTRIMSIYGTGRRASINLVLAAMLVLAPVNAHADGFQDGLTRLAEIFGSIHHLRNICGANDGPLWRNKMIDMMNAAELTPPERKKIITHFNDAYYSARTRYPDCSNDAARKANQLFDEGYSLAKRLSSDRKSSASLF